MKLLKFIEIRSSGNSKTLNTKIIFVQKKNNFWSSQFNYDFEFNEWYKLYNSFTPVINNKSLNQCKLLLYVNAIECTQNDITNFLKNVPPDYKNIINIIFLLILTY